MAAIALVLHGDRSAAVDLGRSLAAWLDERGHEVRATTEDAALVGAPAQGFEPGDLPIGLDLAVSLGGDGTMLRTVRLVAAEDVAVLGVNVGQLGYLTEVEPDGAQVALKRFLAGSYQIEERMLLAVHTDAVASGTVIPLALNEAVVEKTGSGHTVRLDVSIDDERFTTYATDGLIVATPTGSTAYAFSARGPIIAPEHQALLLTPVSPHMLFDRSLVLGPERQVSMQVAGTRPAALSVDGIEVARLEPGDTVTCTAAARTARMVVFRPRDFHRVLKAKFGLADR